MSTTASNPTVLKMLELSTAHITPKTNEQLRANDVVSIKLPIVFYQKSGYGFFIVVPQDAEDRKRLTVLPQDLQDILNVAYQNDCTWIMLDRDAEIYESLPTFEW